MDDFVIVAVSHCIHYLPQKDACLYFPKTLFLSDMVVELSTGHILHDDVYPARLFDDLVDVDYVWVVQPHQDLDLVSHHVDGAVYFPALWRWYENVIILMATSWRLAMWIALRTLEVFPTALRKKCSRGLLRAGTWKEDLAQWYITEGQTDRLLILLIIEPTEINIPFDMGQKSFVIPYLDGSTYEGECAQALPHGKGIVKYPDGSSLLGMFEKGKVTQCKFQLKSNFSKILQYQGQISNRELSGLGTLSYYDGSKLEGNFESSILANGTILFHNNDTYRGTNSDWSCINGLGKFAWSMGDSAEGNFIKSQLNGPGRYCLWNGDFYEGEFKNGIPHGKGRYKQNYGFEYWGDFKNGKMHGRGKLIYLNQDIYEGDFVENRRQGEGIMIFRDGSVFRGALENDMFNGWCRFLYVNAEHLEYNGLVKDNKYHGIGQLIFSNGSRYQGEFKLGQFSGQGKYQFSNNGCYEGGFLDGLFQGQGVLVYSNGDAYEGSFKKGARDGHGRYTEAESRTVIECSWKGGLKQGFCRVTYRNNEYEQGQWFQGNRNGNFITRLGQGRSKQSVY